MREKQKGIFMKNIALLIAILLIPVMTFANQLNDANALRGLKTVKVVCDVNVGNPKLLLRRLELIDETYTQLIDAGIQPTFIVAFRGPASKYVTRGNGYVSPENLATKKEIQGWIAQFHENGFSLEQCAIAARAQKVTYGDVLPQITVVQNGYISIVAYQNKGYALLPMD
jgi:intracellular sulfur oxidation DsrE/DsrF family protein